MVTAAQEIERLQRKIEDGSLNPEEPLFILRAQDCIAGDTVREWATRAYEIGTPEEKVNEAMMLAKEMDQWKPRRIPGR